MIKLAPNILIISIQFSIFKDLNVENPVNNIPKNPEIEVAKAMPGTPIFLASIMSKKAFIKSIITATIEGYFVFNCE
jgi:hypothetical protein